ncbi:MAG: response regulator [Gemmatimonadota bacterium]|nr:response regulator [Gemmatimonadota bacterium]MDH5760146.1 response regulator [Gemmatimonadota bacterium]
MRHRVRSLEALRRGVRRNATTAIRDARAVGHALRGSGGSYGFPEVTVAGAMLEEAADRDVLRRIEGVLRLLRGVTCPDSAAATAAGSWLEEVVGKPVPEPDDPSEFRGWWSTAARVASVGEDDLAARVAEYFGLAVASLDAPQSTATRLIPEAVLAERDVLPLREDGKRLFVAVADPADLSLEAELHALCGREVVLEVSPPTRLAERRRSFLESRTEVVGRVGLAPRDEPGPDRILLVDDDEDSRTLARALLEGKGYSVMEAADGREALDVLASKAVTLAVVDLQMPVMDGKEVLSRMRTDPALAHVPVVILTGNEDTDLEASLIEDGAADYLHKPLDPRLFLARVASTLRRARS